MKRVLAVLLFLTACGGGTDIPTTPGGSAPTPLVVTATTTTPVAVAGEPAVTPVNNLTAYYQGTTCMVTNKTGLVQPIRYRVSLVVDEAWRGRGLGTRLIEALGAKARPAPVSAANSAENSSSVWERTTPSQSKPISRQ